MKATVAEIRYVIEANVVGAIIFQNFWIGQKVLDGGGLGDPEIIGWELDQPRPGNEQVMEWVVALRSGGGVPKPPVSAVTRRQGRLALLEVGRLADVENLIASIPDPVERRAAEIEYEADTWERENAFLQAMWAQLGGTESELDDLFALAATK